MHGSRSSVAFPVPGYTSFVRIITTHLGADFDALGSAMGMRLLVPDARLVFPGSQEVAVRRFLEAERIALPEVRVRELRRSTIELAVVVDCSSFRRLGEVGELIAASGCPVEVVDHHQDPVDLRGGGQRVERARERGREPGVLRFDERDEVDAGCEVGGTWGGARIRVVVDDADRSDEVTEARNGGEAPGELFGTPVGGDGDTDGEAVWGARH